LLADRVVEGEVTSERMALCIGEAVRRVFGIVGRDTLSYSLLQMDPERQLGVVRADEETAQAIQEASPCLSSFAGLAARLQVVRGAPHPSLLASCD